MAIDQQTAKNIKRFTRLRVSFWIILILWVSLFAAPTFFPNMFAMIILLGFISGLVYLFTLGQLAGEADKSVVLWVLGTMMLPLFGHIIGYIRMRGIAIGKGWF